MSGLENLSERDRAVLRSIFDPTATIGDVADDGDSFEEDEDATDTDKKSKELCLQGVQLAEANKLDEALEFLNRSIEVAPERAPGYNDRAQLFRLMKRDDDAMKDLEYVLKLTEGKKTRARALALCQRGVLLRKRGDDDNARAAFAEAAKLGSGFAKKQMPDVSDTLQQPWSREDPVEKVVELNPYAALCNQMLSQVMRGDKEIKL